jgi:hypothetical protein
MWCLTGFDVECLQTLYIDKPLKAHTLMQAIARVSYRVEKKQAIQIATDEDDAEIDPMPVEGGGRKPEPELDRLSNILMAFNEQFGTLFHDSDRIFTRNKDEIAPLVAKDQAFRNARENTPGAARIEHDKALAKVMLTLLKEDTLVYKQFVENEAFRRAVSAVEVRLCPNVPAAQIIALAGDDFEAVQSHGHRKYEGRSGDGRRFPSYRLSAESGTLWANLPPSNKKSRGFSASGLVDSQEKVLERGLEPPRVTPLDP